MSTPPSDAKRTATVVIGLGNPLMGDDGVGLAALKRLQEDWQVPDDVELVDGGTWGMNLLPTIEDAGRLLLIDAIDAGGPPGAAVMISRDELPRYFAMKLSPHQIDLKEVLALAQLRGTLPHDTLAVGLQPGRIELSEQLSDTVAGEIGGLVRRAVAVLQCWGHDCVETSH
jgi:hydrogenase maturation protease